MAARIDDDRNLTDGARTLRPASWAEYTYRKNRDRRTREITVTWLMRALGKSRRHCTAIPRQLERAGYIAVEVVHAPHPHVRRPDGRADGRVFSKASTGPDGLKKLIEPGAPRKSQNNRLRYKHTGESMGAALHGRRGFRLTKNPAALARRA